MAVNKDFGKKAILNVYETLMEALYEYASDKEERTGEEVNVDTFTNEDWYYAMTEYVESDIKDFLVNKLNTGLGSDYLVSANEASVKVLKLIMDNKNKDGNPYWKSVYKMMVAELEQLNGDEFKYWINVYHITRNYGGHEEGGWWYDWSECIESVQVSPEEIHKVEKELQDKHGEGEGDISSVLGGYRVEIRVEDLKGESQDTEVPHYE